MCNVPPEGDESDLTEAQRTAASPRHALQELVGGLRAAGVTAAEAERRCQAVLEPGWQVTALVKPNGDLVVRFERDGQHTDVWAESDAAHVYRPPRRSPCARPRSDRAPSSAGRVPRRPSCARARERRSSPSRSASRSSAGDDGDGEGEGEPPPAGVAAGEATA